MADTPETPPVNLGGRPCKVPTAEQQALICQSIREGNYREVAAQWAGVRVRTFYLWCAKGRKEEDGPYRQFLQAIIEAERAAEMAMVELVVTAAKGDAKHAQWWLSRKFPVRWGSNRLELERVKKKLAEYEKAEQEKNAAKSLSPGGSTHKPADGAPEPIVIDKSSVK